MVRAFQRILEQHDHGKLLEHLGLVDGHLLVNISRQKAACYGTKSSSLVVHIPLNVLVIFVQSYLIH